MFAATRHRNFRLFLTGQFISLCGTWIQTVAQGWLVLQLTNSAFAVGLVTALGSLPILLFTLFGGVVADRVNKRRAVLVLQGLMLMEALALAILTQLELVTVEWVIGLAVFAGLLSAFEVPTRQSLVAEIVDRTDLLNAIALSSSAFNVARVVGPALAGALIATVGLAACFFVNAASYLAVLAALLMMRVERPQSPPPSGSVLAAFREGFGYVLGNPWPRAIMVIVGTLTIFGVAFLPMMPVLARDDLHLEAQGYGALVSAIGIGAASAALFMAAFGARLRTSQLVLTSSVLFGATLSAASLAPEFWSALVLFTVTGCLMALNGIAANTMLQTHAPDYLRGRVLGVYSFLVLGLTPFGSFQAGWVAERFGVRVALLAGGLVCLGVGAGVTWAMRRGQAARWPEAGRAGSHRVIPSEARNLLSSPGEPPLSEPDPEATHQRR